MDPTKRRALIRQKLQAGQLTVPAVAMQRAYAAISIGAHACNACEEPIRADQAGVSIQPNGTRLYFHPQCFRELREAMGIHRTPPGR